MRLRRLEAELAGRVEIHQRSFVLVGEERGERVFLEYHLAHRRAAGQQDTDAPRFDLPEVGHAYPRSSLPALEAAAWVRHTHPECFSRFDLALFEAFFGRTEDISDTDVLCGIAEACGIDPGRIREILDSGSMRAAVLEETQGAFRLGIRGIPAVVITGRPPIIGAIRYADLQQSVRTALESPHPIGEGAVHAADQKERTPG